MKVNKKVNCLLCFTHEHRQTLVYTHEKTVHMIWAVSCLVYTFSEIWRFQ